MDDTMQFAELVRNKREALSMSQSALALACDVSDRTIIRIEGGTRPSPETLMALCSVLGIASTTAHAILATPPRAKDEIDVIVPDALGEELDRRRGRVIRRIQRDDPTLKVIVARDGDALLRSTLGQPPGAPIWTEDLLESTLDDMTPAYIALGRFMTRKLGYILGTLAWTVFTFSCFAIVVVLAVGLVSATHSVLALPVLSVPVVYIVYCAHMMTKIGDRFYDLTKKSAEIFGMADDHIAIANGEAVSVVESSDIRSITYLRTATGHLTVSIEKFSGPAIEIDFIPDDPRIVRAFQRISDNARSAWASPVPGLAAAA